MENPPASLPDSDPVQPLPVWLVTAENVDAAALAPTAELLARFGIPVHRVVGPPDVGFAAGMATRAGAVVVASPDAELPALWAERTAAPVIRVPAAGGGKTALGLLFDDGARNLPAGPGDAVFATMAIGEAGAKNAALFVVATLALDDPRLRAAWAEYRARQTESVLQQPPPTLTD